MKRVVSRMCGVVGLCILVIALSQSGLGQQSKPAPKKTAATPSAKPAESAPSPWLAINVVRVKPDMLADYQEFVRKEAIPTLQKGGIKERSAFATGIFGEAFEYIYVTPISSFSQYDNPGPIVRALGEEAARSFNAKARRFLISSRTYAVQNRPDLSYEGKMTWPPKIAVINSIYLVPGKNQAFEAIIKNDILPAVKKAGVVAYLVSQTVFGGDSNEYISLTLMDNFAELDKGPPVVRGMGGQAAFERFLPKVSGVIARQERSISRFVPDMSFPVPPRAESR